MRQFEWVSDIRFQKDYNFRKIPAYKRREWYPYVCGQNFSEVVNFLEKSFFKYKS